MYFIYPLYFHVLEIIYISQTNLCYLLKHVILEIQLSVFNLKYEEGNRKKRKDIDN